MPKRFEITDYKLSRVVAEIKFPNAYEHWDSAGSLWRTFNNKYRDLVQVKASPEKTAFICNKFYQLEVGLDSARVLCAKKTVKEKEFVELVVDFFTHVVTTLKIVEINRIGYRTFRLKEHNSINEASEEIFGYSLIKKPVDNLFGIENGDYLSPQYVISRENEYLGIKINILTNAVKVQLTIPFDLSEYLEEESYKEFVHSTIDIDYYTKKTMLLSELDLLTWLNEAELAVKRDLAKVFD